MNLFYETRFTDNMNYFITYSFLVVYKSQTFQTQTQLIYHYLFQNTVRKTVKMFAKTFMIVLVLTCMYIAAISAGM